MKNSVEGLKDKFEEEKEIIQESNSSLTQEKVEENYSRNNMFS